MIYPGDSVDPEHYTAEFEKHLEELEKWIEKDIIPKTHETGRIEYHTINKSVLDIDRLYPKHYSEATLKVRELAKTETYAKLSDVANIINPIEDAENRVLVKKFLLGHFPSNILVHFSPPLLRYYLRYTIDPAFPVDVNALSQGVSTDTPIQQGDILTSLKGKKSFYLHRAKTEEEIHVAPSVIEIIRAKAVPPEYLYLYLHSETATVYINEINKGSVKNRRETWKDVPDLPIPIPKYPEERYQYILNVFSNSQKRYYTNEFQEINSRVEAIVKGDREAETIEDLFNVELMENLKIHSEIQLSVYFQRELDELETCFDWRQYKTITIIAGSILETFLKDWISEMDGKDYFEIDSLKISDEGSEIQNPKLIHYIDAVQHRLKKRGISWTKEYRKATAINDKLNLIRGSPSLTKGELSWKTGKKLIADLKDILRSRGLEIC